MVLCSALYRSSALILLGHPNPARDKRDHPTIHFQIQAGRSSNLFGEFQCSMLRENRPSIAMRLARHALRSQLIFHLSLEQRLRQ